MEEFKISEKIICKKDWFIDGKRGFIKGKAYKILKKEYHGFAKCIYLKAENGFEGWFWSDSDYFNVESAFE